MQGKDPFMLKRFLIMMYKFVVCLNFVFIFFYKKKEILKDVKKKKYINI